MPAKEVFLEGNPPWGFRMNGGADAGHQLRISRVNPGSKAEAKGVREGDLITSINGQSTKCLTNSESHALLRSVKENLFLGLNEGENASPRRRSREIKSASIISQEKERSESPAQPKGKTKPSANQKRHQRRTRLKHRIKEILGFKSSEKNEPEDKGWVIIDNSLNSLETKSISELDFKEENKLNTIQSSEEAIENNCEEIYDNFDFKVSRESSQTPTSAQTSVSLPERRGAKDIGDNHKYEYRKDSDLDIEDCFEPIETIKKLSQSVDSNSNQNNTLEKLRNHEEKIACELTEKIFSDDVWLPMEESTQIASKACICEDEEISESLKVLLPTEMVEICNATIMIEDESPVVLPVVTEEDPVENSGTCHNSNPDYEPVEVNSSVIIYPPYNSTLSYYFPQRLEAIAEENSDLSEGTEEKHEKQEKKPWENSELIKKSNDFESLPNDWYGSDEGIDTSWRDGKSIEEASDVAVVSDSFSDSDLISDDLKMLRGVSEDKTIKYSISSSKVNEKNLTQQSKKCNVVLGKPPIRSVSLQKDDMKSQGIRIHSLLVNKSVDSNKCQLTKNAEVPNNETQKRTEPKPDSVGNKVTCRVIKQNDVLSNTINETDINVSKELPKGKVEYENFPKKEIVPVSIVDKKIPDNCQLDLTKNLFQRVPKQEADLTKSQKCDKKIVSFSENKNSNNTKVFNKSNDDFQPKSPSQSNKYIKTIPSSSVLKNVGFSYYNSSNNAKEIEIEETKKISDHSHIKLKKDVIKPGSDKDVELIYIDSSDSDAVSASNRTSLDKEELHELNEDDNSIQRNCHEILVDEICLIKKEITNISESVKEISDLSSSSLNLPEKNCDLPPNINQNSTELAGLERCVLPNLLSPILSRKSSQNKQSSKKRRFSFPMSSSDLLKKSDEVYCYNCKSPMLITRSIIPEMKLPSKNHNVSLNTPSRTTKESKLKDSPLSIRKLCLRSLPSSPNSYNDLPKKSDYHSTESIVLEYSDDSLSSESYTLPDVAQDNDLSDVSCDTIKYFRMPICSPPDAYQDPIVTTEIVDLHKKFLERRGYHEPSPVLKRKSQQANQKPPEPDLIVLSKCQVKSEQAYTPELLAEAANLLALHKYHETRQRKMKVDSTKQPKYVPHLSKPSKSEKESDIAEVQIEINVTDSKKCMGRESEKDMNEKVIENKLDSKSVCTENETVGKSRLLELFQKLELKSSATDCSLSEPELLPNWLILGDFGDIRDINELPEKSEVCISEQNNESEADILKIKIKNAEPVAIKCKKDPDSESQFLEELKSVTLTSGNTSYIVVKPSLPAGEIFQRKMYEEYLDKMAELAERRNMKIIKVSSVPNSVSPPKENQPLESEFMCKLKERNEKLGIVIDVDENHEKLTSDSASSKELPKHLKELMEITEECGGVWSPAQTPEAERKKFDFSNELREEKEREKQKEEEEKKEPQPLVWTPRSAGASPTFDRKFRPVNFASPTPSRKEIKTPIETPELPKDLPVETEKDSKLRLISSSSENSTLSSSLRLPSSQNPTITLLQKAREGHIPRGAQYLDELPIVGPNEIIYSVKKEHASEDNSKKIVELGPRKIEGIGPTTKEGIPTVLRSEVKEDNQQRWYKRMYDSLHKADIDKDFVTVKYKTRRGQYPYSSYAGGYASEPERIGYDSDASLSKYATLDRRKIRNKENDFTTSTMPRNRYAPGVKFAVNVYKNQPGRIEDYEPGNSSIADKEKKQWWDEVMDIFDGELTETRSNISSSKFIGKPYTYSLKDAGYESDSTLVFKRRENHMSGQMLSPTEQKMAYKVIQKGGEVPFQGLRKTVPDRPKEPLGNPIPTPPRDTTSRQRIQESPHRYVESEVNIHYKSPVRREAKAVWPEDELAQRQAEIMRRIYQEQKRTKYLNELHDMYSRRHADNLLPSQKSPIPLNRYDDFPVEVQPPRPRDRTPEPKLVARALYNFVGQTSRELSFRRGDIIYVRRQIDKNWYEGEHNAMIGLFPFNYVEIIPYDGIRTFPKKANEGQARAKFNFQAQTHLELSLVKGELVLLTRRVDENWFEGRIGNRKGIFPVSYVEVLVEPGERAETPTSGTPSKPIVAPASHSVLLNGAKDLGQQHYQPPRPTIYSSSSLPPSSKMNDISLVNQTLHIDTQSDPVPYRVMYNYRPQNEDELELKEGDIVYVMEKCDDGWYVGSLHRNGQFGTFPGNYVERIQ